MGFTAAIEAIGTFVAEEVATDVVVGAATDAFGTEFLAAGVDVATTSVFDTVAPSLADFAGYESVGSFAGDAEWVNQFYPGSIVDSGVTSVDTFSEFVQTADPFADTVTWDVAPELSDVTWSDISGQEVNLQSTVNGELTTTVADTAPVAEVPASPVQDVAKIVVDDSGVPLLPQDVAVVNSGELTPSLYDTAYAKVADYVGNLTTTDVLTKGTQQVAQSAVKQVATGAISRATGLPPQLVNYTLGSATSTLGPYVGTPGIVPGDTNVGYVNVTGSPYDDEGNLNLGWELDENNDPVYVGPNNPIALTPENVITGANAPGNFVETYNSSTGLWDVVNKLTGQTVSGGLTQNNALLAARDFNINQAGINLNTGPTNQTLPGGAFDVNGQLNPGYILGAGGIPVFIGQALSSLATGSTAAGTVQGLIQQAQQQQTIRDQRQNKAQSTDWRVRLRLAPQANYLYNDPACGPVLYPLHVTDGVIFPYTPSIDIGYKANYDAYDLTHSNFRGYFYKGSYIDAVNLRATFTAQDTNEANYLLAVIHFFRSVTKMFYGQDSQRGAPPPLVYLTGLGDFQFNEHPCVVQQFNYNLPAEVDYIRAQSTTANGTNLLQNRKRQYVSSNPIAYALQRLATVGLPKGALDVVSPGQTLGVGNPTYVPTKIDIQLTLLPIQSRSQVSQQFSLRNFANGNLLKGGFW